MTVSDNNNYKKRPLVQKNVFKNCQTCLPTMNIWQMNCPAMGHGPESDKKPNGSYNKGTSE